MPAAQREAASTVLIGQAAPKPPNQTPYTRHLAAGAAASCIQFDTCRLSILLAEQRALVHVLENSIVGVCDGRKGCGSGGWITVVVQ